MHNLCIYPELLIQHGSTHSALSDRLSFYLIFKLQLVFTCHISMLFSLPSCITSGILIYPSLSLLSLGYVRQRSSHFLSINIAP